jgi:cytochrome c biogenesis protein CcdA
MLTGKLARVAALLGLVLAVGIVDSLNPSTIAPALYLAAGAGADAGRGMLAFAAGAFAVYAGGGLVLVLGPGRALLSHRPRPHTVSLLELCLGAALVAVAGVLWLVRDHVARHAARNQGKVAERTPFLLGAAIMAVELPTALPYFAVLAAVADSGRSAAEEILLVLLFNVMFVSPLLAIAAIRALAGTRGRDVIERTRQRLDRHAGEIAPALVLAVGVVLMAIGGAGLS